MQFCPIVPIKWLDKFAVQSQTHMVLAQHLDICEYFEFYRARVEAGDAVILDNGAYEDEPVSFPELLKRIQALQPTYYVLPDEPNKFDMSGIMSLDFIKFIKGENVLSRRLWIVHATPGHITQFIQAYELGCTNAHGVGFSRLTEDYGFGSSNMRRVQFIRHLKRHNKWQPDKYVHAFGMLNGSVAELPYLAEEGVHSIDSSAPVWRGLMGFKLSSNYRWPDHKFQVAYKGPISSARLESTEQPSGLVWAQQNLDLVMHACAHESRQLV